MSNRSETIKAPAHLSAEARRFWDQTVRDYALQPHHIHTLLLACEAKDRCTQAREAIDRDGITFKDRFGGVRPNPACAIERDSRIGFIRAVRELRLDGDDTDTPRPPSLGD
jgi:P27 family predicted phage terminase small subunit